MPKKTRASDSNSPARTILAVTIAIVRDSRPFILPTLALAFAALAALLVYQRTDRFLSQNNRFRLRTGELGQRQSPDLYITGVSRAPLAEVQGIFLEDEGRSVFDVPLTDRRKRIERVTWIRQASVSRIWPNRLYVAVAERVPVAYVHLPPRRRGQPVKPRLIDAEGVMLPVPENFRGRLPVLSGVREDQAEQDRAQRVRLASRLLEELGELGKPVPEIDVRDVENLKIVYPAGGRALTLILGSDHWRERVEKFLHYYPEIKSKMKNVVELDLRLRDRIVATEFEKEVDGQ